MIQDPSRIPFTKGVSIPLSPEERNEVFEIDGEAVAKALHALALVRSKQISGERFLRVLANCRGEALARFTKATAELARARLQNRRAEVPARYLAPDRLAA